MPPATSCCARSRKRLTDSVRTEDTVARLGGDEFAVIQVGVAHPDGPGIMAERLVKAIGKPFELGGQQTMIGTSIGIALYPGDGEEGDDLVRAADTALYRAKEAGRGTFRFFEADMDIRLQERRMLERDLRQALAERSSSGSTTSRWPIAAAARSSASRRWCAGPIRSAARSHRCSSFRSPRNAA